MRRTLLVAVLFFLAACRLAAQTEPPWEPVTEKDWAVTADSAKRIADAAMVFEHVLADESNAEDECLMRVYRRIRIFSAAGKRWGDVAIRYAPEGTKIEHIAGRTILRDGTIIPLNRASIAERTVVQTDEFEMKESFFSLPGVTDDCVVEYWYEEKDKSVNETWVPQKDIAVLDWEYRWKYYKPKNTVYTFWSLFDFVVYGQKPNYVLVNFPFPAAITTEPAEGEPEVAVFRAANLPALLAEPFMPPDEAVRANVRFFYGDPGPWEEYWDQVSAGQREWLRQMEEKDGDAEDIAKQFSHLATTGEKADSVFVWLQHNIRNIVAEPMVEKPEMNKSVKDVLNRKYGHSYDIAAAFSAILHRLGVTSRVYAVPSRAKRKFYIQAKYWQFDGAVVLVNDSAGRPPFLYAPGEPGALPRKLPWYFESVDASVMNPELGEKLFVKMPQAPPSDNTSRCDMSVELTPDEPVRYEVTQRHTGQEARRIRALLHNKQKKDWPGIVRADLLTSLADGWKDSVLVSSVALSGDTVVARYRFAGPPLEAGADGRIVLQPFAFIAHKDNPFREPTRKHPIDLEYMDILSWRITYTIPASLKAEVLPEPIHFKNGCGSVELLATADGNLLTIDSRRQFRQALFEASLHLVVGEMYDYRAKLFNTAIVLKGAP